MIRFTRNLRNNDLLENKRTIQEKAMEYRIKYKNTTNTKNLKKRGPNTGKDSSNEKNIKNGRNHKGDRHKWKRDLGRQGRPASCKD